MSGWCMGVATLLDNEKQSRAGLDTSSPKFVYKIGSSPASSATFYLADDRSISTLINKSSMDDEYLL